LIKPESQAEVGMYVFVLPATNFSKSKASNKSQSLVQSFQITAIRLNYEDVYGLVKKFSPSQAHFSFVPFALTGVRFPPRMKGRVESQGAILRHEFNFA
jgi:hypothetical protein